MVVHDIFHIDQLCAGIQLYLKPLRIVGHQAFLHAVKALVQPDAVHVHLLENRQVFIGNPQSGKHGRTYIRDDFHAALMGRVRQQAELTYHFFPALIPHAQQAGKDTLVTKASCFPDIRLVALGGGMLRINGNT